MTKRAPRARHPVDEGVLVGLGHLSAEFQEPVVTVSLTRARAVDMRVSGHRRVVTESLKASDELYGVEQTLADARHELFRSNRTFGAWPCLASVSVPLAAAVFENAYNAALLSARTDAPRHSSTSCRSLSDSSRRTP